MSDFEDGKLQEQVELFRREINRLEYQNDQVSKVHDLEQDPSGNDLFDPDPFPYTHTHTHTHTK